MIPHNVDDCSIEVRTPSGDVNRDDTVEMQDIGMVVFAYGSDPKHPRWDYMADLNVDLRIDLKDIAFTARHFGETDP
jgi:hypothetical protein